MTLTGLQPPGSRHAIGHSIAAVSFVQRRLECSCGLVLFQDASDEAQGESFYRHRQTAPPERQLPRKGPHQGMGIVRQTETMVERTRGW